MRLPRTHNKRINALADLTDVNRWASDVDLSIGQIIETLKEQRDRFVPAITTNRGTKIGKHAPQHRPGAFDALSTGPPTVDLSATTSNLVGTGTSFSRNDHQHKIVTAAPSGGYGVASSVGSGANLMRADAVLVYPEALGTSADRSKTITLTDDGTEGAVLTASNNFSVNNIFIKTPNATDGLRIYNDGGIAIGAARSQNAAIDVTWVKSTSVALQGQDGDVTQTGTSSITGMTYSTNLAPAAANANNCTGVAWSASMNNANATGSARAATFSISCAGVATRADHLCVRATISTLLGNTSTNVTLFEANDVTSAFGGTLTNLLMYNSTNMRIGGTLRVGYNSVGASSGTPADVYNFRGLSHSSGTNKHGVYTDNKHECGLSDFIALTAGKGLTVKDNTDGNFYRIFTVNGFIQTANLGTTAPTS